MMKLSVAMLMLLTSHILHTVNTISLTFTRSYTALGRNQLFESDKLACTGLVTVAPNNAATVGGWFKGSSCDYLKMPDLLDTATASQTGNYFKFIRVTKTTSGTTALRIWPCNQWVFIAYRLTMDPAGIVSTGKCNTVEESILSNLYPSALPGGTPSYRTFQISGTGPSQTFMDSTNIDRRLLFISASNHYNTEDSRINYHMNGPFVKRLSRHYLSRPILDYSLSLLTKATSNIQPFTTPQYTAVTTKLGLKLDSLTALVFPSSTRTAFSSDPDFNKWPDVCLSADLMLRFEQSTSTVIYPQTQNVQIVLTQTGTASLTFTLVRDLSDNSILFLSPDDNLTPITSSKRIASGSLAQALFNFEICKSNSVVSATPVTNLVQISVSIYLNNANGVHVTLPAATSSVSLSAIDSIKVTRTDDNNPEYSIYLESTSVYTSALNYVSILNENIGDPLTENMATSTCIYRSVQVDDTANTQTPICLRCSDGYYPDAGNPGACTTCPTGVARCESSTYFVTCSDGYYFNTGTSTCDQCNSKCATCTGSSFNDCITCAIASPQLYIIQGSTCTTCLAEPGYSFIGSVCTQCYNTCMACTGVGSTQCTSCYSASANKYLTPGGSCTDCLVSSGSYPSGSNCFSCHANCQTCTGATASDCVACANGLYMRWDSSCGVCNTGSAEFITGSNCQQCHSSCATCTDANANSCLSCTGPDVLKWDGTCGTCQVASGEFMDGSICRQCNTLCKTCTGVGSTQCVSCYSASANNYLTPGGSCTDCLVSSGSYPSGSNCLPCTLPCQTCTGSTTSDCASCHLGQYLRWDSSCGVCNTGSAEFITGSNCQQCHSSCATCSGPLPTNCLSCTGPDKLHQNYTCGPCNTSEPYFATATHCSLCGSTCQTCANAVSCSSCKPSYSLFENTGACVQCSSNPDHYLDISSNTCLKCHSSCKSCSGPEDTNCTACTGPRYLATGNTCSYPTVTISSTSHDDTTVTATTNDSVRVAVDRPTDGLCGVIDDGSTRLVTDVFRKYAGYSLEDRIGKGGLVMMGLVHIQKVSTNGRNFEVILKAPTEVLSGVLVCLWNQKIVLRSQSHDSIYLHDDFINFENVTLFGAKNKQKLKEDEASMRKAAQVASYGIVSATIVIFSMNPSSGFSLVRIFQNLDLYGYVNCKITMHLSVVLDNLTGDPLDLIDNPLTPLVLEAGGPLPYKFEKYGLQTHIVNNFGVKILLACVLIILRFVIASLLKVLKARFKNKILRRLLDYTRIQLWPDLFDTYMIDYVVSLSVFFAVRPKPLSNNDSIFGIVFSILGAGYIGYCIFAIVKISQIKGKLKASGDKEYSAIKKACPNFTYLLEDTRLDVGLAPYINMIQVSKEVISSCLIYFMYDYATGYMAIKLTMQLVVFAIVVKIRPSTDKWENAQQIYQIAIFTLIDLFFLLICILGNDLDEATYNMRYGYPVIGLILLLIVGKMIFGVCALARQLCKRKVKIGPRSLLRLNANAECEREAECSLPALDKKSKKATIRVKLKNNSPLKKDNQNILLKNLKHEEVKLEKIAASDQYIVNNHSSVTALLQPPMRSPAILKSIESLLGTPAKRIKYNSFLKVTISRASKNPTGSPQKIALSRSPRQISVHKKMPRKHAQSILTRDTVPPPKDAV